MNFSDYRQEENKNDWLYEIDFSESNYYTEEENDVTFNIDDFID